MNYFKKQNINFKIKFVPLMLLTIILCLIWNVFILFIFTEYLGVQKIYNKSDNSIFSDILRFTVLVVITSIIVPIFEEFVYRFTLNISKSGQIINSFLYVLIVFSLLASNGKFAGYLFIIQIIILIINLFYLMFNKFKDYEEDNTSLLFIITSILIFCISHISRYNISNNLNLTCVIVMLILQFGPIASYYSYLRLKYKDGYSVAVLAHSFSNLVPTILVYFAQNL